MKKKVKKYKIAQTGIDNNTNSLAWNSSSDINGQPQAATPQRFVIDANGNNVDTLTGKTYYASDPNQSTNQSMNLNNTVNNQQVKYGQYHLNPIVQGANTLIDATTAIGRLANNPKRDEKKKYLDSIQPRAYENKDENGLNNIPTYFQNGGNSITPEKARQILKDGKANGKPLTDKQKKYFGYVIGESEKKMQKGGNVPEIGYNKYSGAVNETGSHDYLNNDQWIHNMSEYMKNNNPDSNIYRNEYQHHNINMPLQQFNVPSPTNQYFVPQQEPTPQNINNTFAQNGGGMNRPITAEAGEVYKDINGGMNKIPDHMDTHDDTSGGVQVDNAAQVLEDTGDKRNDIDSKLLLIKPKEMLDISGLKTTKPITHSKAFELMTKDADKNSKYIQNFLKKNANSLQSSSNDFYAKNSMDLNTNLLGAVPTQADIFNKLFAHQEDIKAKYQIDNEGNQEMQNGGDAYKTKLDKLDSLRAQQALGNNTDNTDYNQQYNNLFQKASRDALGNPQTNQGVVAPDTQGIRAYTGDINDKSNASIHTDAEWNQFAKDSGFTGNTNRDFQTHLFNMNGSNGGPNIQNSILGLHNQFGNPNTPPSDKSMYNWIDGRLGHRWDKAYESFYANKNPQDNSQTPTDANDYFSSNTTPQQVPQNQPNLGAFGQPQGQTNKNPDNSFNAPLQWYDTAAATYGLIDSFGRRSTPYDGVNLNTPKAKYQNPLPVLQQGQADYNSVINTLPQNGVGMANAANVFGKKYALNDQVLGSYENINNNIWNNNESAVVNTKNAQSQADLQSRQLFEQKQLQGIENQRQQFFQSLKDLTGTIGSNAKYNREGNLLMKLFPAFTQNGQYDGYKYNFTNPGRSNNTPTAPITAPKKTIKKTK